MKNIKIKKIIFSVIFIILFSIFYNCKKSPNDQYVDNIDPTNPITPPSEETNNNVTSIWDGTISEPNMLNGNTYEINTASELAWIAKESNDDTAPKNFENITIKLNVNIDFNNNLNFNGIAVGGDFDNNGIFNTFKGIFDGNGKKVINIHIKISEYAGFIGHLQNGKIKNLGVEQAVVKGDWAVGGIVGNIEGSSAGVENSYYLGVIEGGDNVGGITGHNNGGSIINSYSFAIIVGRFDGIGGIVGVNYGGYVENSYNLGPVQGNAMVGGVAGNNDSGSIEYCYNMNTVEGTSEIGGVVGSNNNQSAIIDSFFIKSDGGINSGLNGIGFGIGEALGKNYNDFKNQNTFTGWNFSTTWKMSSDKPILKWQ